MPSSNSLTLSAALDLFLLEDRARSTRDTYRKILTRALRYLGPARPVTAINREDVLRYVAHLRQQGTRYDNHPRRPAEQGGLSPRTVEKHVKTLRTFFKWIERQGYRAGNPTEDLSLRHYRRPPGVSKAATPGELQKIMEIAEAKARLGRPLHLAVFLFLCDTGCRAGEAASLTVGNLLLDQCGAWVTGKGDKTRPVFYGQHTAQVLRAWLDVHPNPSQDALVFNLSSESLSQVIRRLAQRADIQRPVSAHAIRHRVGQVWASAKLSEQATQLKLGHDSPSITMEMYYNTTWEHIQQASKDLSLAAIYGLPSEPQRLAGPFPLPILGTRTGTG